MAEGNKVLSWSDNWDLQPMSQIEQAIKSTVNSKITMGELPAGEGDGTSELPSYILTLNSVDGATSSWLAGVVKSEDLLKNVQSIKENDATIEFLKPITISASSADSADIVANSITAGTITVAELSGGNGEFTTITGDITSDKIEIFEKTVTGEGTVEVSEEPVISITQEGIIANSGNFDILNAGNLSATAITSEKLVGTKLYIGNRAIDPSAGNIGTFIDLTPDHFSIPELAATTASITNLKIGAYDALNGYSTELQYRPIRFAYSEPTGSNYTPGTLVAVLKSST